MEFSVIRTYCALRFRDTGLVVVSDANWKQYVNSAYGNVLISMPYAPWDEAVSTGISVAAGAAVIAVPADVWRINAVYDSTNQFPLVPLEGRDQVYNEYPDQTIRGQSMHYRMYGQSLNIYPLPASATTFTVEYFTQPAALSADADIPIFPSQYHDILVPLAVAMAYRDDGNNDLAQQYEAEGAQMLAALKIEAGQPRQSRFYEPVDSFL